MLESFGLEIHFKTHLQVGRTVELAVLLSADLSLDWPFITVPLLRHAALGLDLQIPL